MYDLEKSDYYIENSGKSTGIATVPSLMFLDSKSEISLSGSLGETYIDDILDRKISKTSETDSKKIIKNTTGLKFIKSSTRIIKIFNIILITMVIHM